MRINKPYFIALNLKARRIPLRHWELGVRHSTFQTVFGSIISPACPDESVVTCYLMPGWEEIILKAVASCLELVTGK